MTNLPTDEKFCYDCDVSIGNSDIDYCDECDPYDDEGMDDWGN